MERWPPARASGKRPHAQTEGPSSAEQDHLSQGSGWSQENLLYGTNGIAALTFCDVPLAPAKPKR